MTPQGFAVLAEVLRGASGLAIGPDKLYLLQTRLEPLLRAHALPDLDALARRLGRGGDRALAGAMVQAMTTNETSFFRDRRPFAHVRDHALARLHAARPAGVRLRLWSAAASSGQEAYSLAMLVDQSRTRLAGRGVDILATDIAAAPLARAEAGLYTQFEVQRGLPAPMLQQYFRQQGGLWRIAGVLRDMVAFRQWNLLADLRPLGRFDLVFCRNVLLYFDPPTRALVLAAMAQQMAPDALLYLGGAESLLGVTDMFTELAGHRGVYALAPAAVACHVTA